MRKQPEQQPPAVQRLRLQYAKRGPARFASHRDFARAFERALRRADVPMAYSSGFSPHPKISYAGAAPTGAASEAEYLEIALAQRCDPEQLRRTLASVLPPVLPIVRVVEASGGPLPERMQASRWLLDFGAADPAELSAAVADYLAADELEVERHTKKGVRRFDVRSAVVSMTLADAAQVDVVIRHTEPLVRPDDVARALRRLHPALDNGCPALATRLEQGPLSAAGAITDPLVANAE